MANCGACGNQPCGCHFVSDEEGTTVAEGSGSLFSPFSARPSAIPNLRPIGDIGRADGDSAVAVPASTQTVVNFTDSLAFHSTTGNTIDSGMVNLVAFPTRITCTVAGKYLVGGQVEWEPAITATGDTTRHCYLSEGIPAGGAGANIYASMSAVIIVTPSRQILCPQALVHLDVGDYIEMYLFSTRAGGDSTDTGASVEMYAVWMGF